MLNENIKAIRKSKGLSRLDYPLAKTGVTVNGGA